MKIFMTLGKALTLVFWGVVLANLLQPFTQPFALLINVAGVVILLIHLLELWFFRKRITAGEKPIWARLQVILFGVFQLFGLPAEHADSAPQDHEHAAQKEPENA